MKEIVLDTETTGLSIKDGHRIVEICCIELEYLVDTKKYLSKKGALLDVIMIEGEEKFLFDLTIYNFLD